MTEADTAALVARAAAGDAEAFTRLVRAHQARVVRWALVVSGDRDDADDLAQAVWIKVYRGLGAYRGDARFSTWLYRITYRTAVESGRTSRRRTAALSAWQRDTIDQAAVSAPDDPDRAQLVGVVRAMLAGLPPRQRAVFAMADLEGIGTAEIAERLEIAEATVRVTLFNARRAMRARLLAQEPKLIEEHRS